MRDTLPRAFEHLKTLSDAQLREALNQLLGAEATLEQDFRKARSRLTDMEWQIGGFENYGAGGRHYAFRNILHNLKIELRDDLPSKPAAQ